MRLASFGEPIALAKILMLQLQSFDYQSGTRVPYKDLDYGIVEAWLSRILELDPKGQYPLLAASRLYAEVPDEARARSMIDFVYRQYLLDPNRRWPWLAHATFLAKYRLKDIPLALKYADALQKYTTAKDVPAWVITMGIFIREDLNELRDGADHDRRHDRQRQDHRPQRIEIPGWPAARNRGAPEERNGDEAASGSLGQITRFLPACSLEVNCQNIDISV